MKQDKGFTLIELLAVIVILAVIALIATPLIMGTITKAKKNSFIDTAYGILKAGENYQAMNQVESNGDIPYLFIQNLETEDKLNYKGSKPKAGKLLINVDGNSALVAWSGQFCAKKSYQDSKIVVDEKIHTKEDCMNSAMKTTTYSYTGNVQEFTASKAGTYLIELWGASGGGNTPNDKTKSSRGGAGAYTSGMISLEQNTKLYLYVGGKGKIAETDSICSQIAGGGYNGGGNGHCSQTIAANDGYGGGGATDVRLVTGTWDNFNSLKSRIMVAGGGGGADNSDKEKFIKGDDGTGGAGGNLTGENAYIGGTQLVGTALNLTYIPGIGGSQTGGNGFGKGGSTISNYEDNAGAGSGYYGGFATNHNNGGGAGGSSFISGYAGCDAIAEVSTESNIVHTGQPIHYSGKTFTGGLMKNGTSTMPNPTGTGEIIGNIGNGYARITFISTNA